MDIESFRNFCLSLPDVTEEFPFGPTTLVFKIHGKLFALTGLDVFESINLKCDPELAVELRERYAAVLPGYHMNKQHWNTVLMNQTVPDKLVLEWTKNSYDLVRAKVPKNKKL